MEDLPKDAKKGMTFKFVKTVGEALKEAMATDLEGKKARGQEKKKIRR
jgi:hypothetical protein